MSDVCNECPRVLQGVTLNGSLRLPEEWPSVMGKGDCAQSERTIPHCGLVVGNRRTMGCHRNSGG